VKDARLYYLWPVEQLPGARLVAVRRAHRSRIRPPWEWCWRRILTWAVCLGGLYYVLSLPIR
jgi:hypothetical protein